MLLSDCALVKHKKKNVEKYNAIWMDGWMYGQTELWMDRFLC